MPTTTSNKVENTERPRAQQLKRYPTTSLQPCDLTTCSRKQIREYFENSYHLDEGLYSALKDEKYFFTCPDRLRLPLIFYLGHTATLYVNKLMLTGLIEKRVNHHFEALFETGVDEMSWDDTENYRMGGSYKWPAVSEVMDYREKVRELVLRVIEGTPFDLPITTDHPWWAVFMSFEHERIHLETSSVLLRQLPVDYLKRPKGWKYAPPSMDTPAGPNILVKVARGRASLGKPADFPSYGWDNEYGSLEVDVPEFEATRYLVTNKEFLEFVEDGGYERKELWTKEGWKWKQFRQACHPTFWVCDRGCPSGCGADLSTHSHCTGGASGGVSSGTSSANGTDAEAVNGASNGTSNGHDASNGHGTSNGASNGHGASNDCLAAEVETKYKYRAIFDVLEMPWDWPVDANYHEAKAFCTWKGEGFRMPTEAEHHRMRGDPPPSTDTACDPIFNPDYPANINLKFGSSSPVNMFPPNSMGFHDTYGNVWEWTEDHFNGFPGYKSNYLYDDFSSPCFDGRHNMMMEISARANQMTAFAQLL